MKVIMDAEGRIALPKVICDELGLGPGTQCSLSVENNAIVLKPVHFQGRQLNFAPDGRPYFTAMPCFSIKDEDVQRLRYDNL